MWSCSFLVGATGNKGRMGQAWSEWWGCGWGLGALRTRRQETPFYRFSRRRQAVQEPIKPQEPQSEWGDGPCPGTPSENMTLPHLRLSNLNTLHPLFRAFPGLLSPLSQPGLKVKDQLL